MIMDEFSQKRILKKLIKHNNVISKIERNIEGENNNDIISALLTIFAHVAAEENLSDLEIDEIFDRTRTGVKLMRCSKKSPLETG